MFLVTVPPFLALYFGLLYLQTTLDTNKNIVDRWQGERSVLIRVDNICPLFVPQN